MSDYNFNNADAVKKQPPARTEQFGAIPLEDNGAHHQYPQAEINDTSALPPADGEPLFPEESATNPNLNRFVKQGFKDLWAGAILAALFLMVVIWGIVNACSYTPISTIVERDDDEDEGEVVRSLSTTKMVLSLLGGFAVSVGAAVLCLFITQRIPRQLIYIANVLVIVLYVLAALFSGDVVVAIVMLILAGLQGLWFFFARRRIPFSAALLATSSKVLSKHPGIVVNNFVFSVVSCAWMICWCFTALPPIDRINAAETADGDADAGAGDIVLLFFFVFVAFWVLQVLPNIMHVTTAGVVATWYFAGFENLPRAPTLASLKRALTTSFGSICFGSLIVAIIQFLKFLAESSRGDNGGNFVQCILVCLLGCLESLVRYFNTYAFVHVAIYGCGYIDAAKRTFGLIKQCLFAALFNDCLVGPTLSMLAFAMALVIGVLFGLLSQSWPMGIIIFFMAWVVHSLFFTAITSSVVTIFVCFAEVPEALRTSDPELYTAIHTADAGGTNNNAVPIV